MATASALDLIDLNGVFLATTGTFHYSTRDLIVAGGISADMHASAHLALAIQPDGTIGVTVSDVTAVVGPLAPQFTGPDGNTLDGFITVGNNDFRMLVENLIQQQLIPTFTDKIPPLLEQLLGATDKLLDNVSFSLDSKLGTPVTLTLNGKVGGLDVVPGPAIGVAPGHVTVRQGVSITTSATAPVHPTSRGALRVSSSAALPATPASALEVVLSEDFLNAMLHSLWNSGLLDGSASFGGLTAAVSAKLPPVAIPTPDGSDCASTACAATCCSSSARSTSSFPTSTRRSRSRRPQVRASSSTARRCRSRSSRRRRSSCWETSEVPGRLSTAAVHDIISTVVWPQLFGAIGNNLHITLPIPDLAALGLSSLSPNLANAQLTLAVRQHASIDAGYLSLGADLELQTPHP